MELGHAKRIFIQAKKSENVAARTLETYSKDLKRFFDFLFERNIFDITEVDADYIREFLVELKSKGAKGKELKGITVHQFFRVIRTFFIFLHREGYITKNPIVNVKAPKVEKKIMRTFTAQEISKLLNAFDKNTYIGLRNYCIMCLFFSTGIRKGEVANLTMADLSIVTHSIRIKGKGDKERYAPIGRTLRLVLARYLNMRKEFLEEESCKWLFVTPRIARKMSSSCLSVLFQKLKKTLKMTGEKVSCHTWRHTFAKNYLLNGGETFSLQKILGHSDIATTEQYVNLNEKEIQVQHAKYNPLDNRDWLY